MRRAGVSGATAVTMVTAVLAGVLVGTGTSSAREARAGAEAPRAGGADRSAGTDRAAGADRTTGAVSGGEARRDQRIWVAGRFAPPRSSPLPRALTYDQRRVPVGAGIGVAQRVHKGKTTVRVAVHGVAPRHTFGVHVHTKPCGALPDDSGPHYQNVKDPQQPSTDPRFANPHNEVWLDLTTTKKGSGTAVSRNDWTFRAGEARSVVLHERATHTGPGHAGQAGDRLACFSVPFTASAGGH